MRIPCLVNTEDLQCLVLVDNIEPGRVGCALEAAEQSGLAGVADFALGEPEHMGMLAPELLGFQHIDGQTRQRIDIFCLTIVAADGDSMLVARTMLAMYNWHIWGG